MSEKMNHIYTCDSCNAETDVGFKGFPSDWIEVKMETTNGRMIFYEIQLCPKCAFPEEREERASLLVRMFNLKRKDK